MSLSDHTSTRMSTKICMTTLNDTLSRTMKVNKSFSFLASQEQQPCVQVEPSPQVQQIILFFEEVKPTQIGFRQNFYHKFSRIYSGRSSPRITLNMFATTCLGRNQWRTIWLEMDQNTLEGCQLYQMLQLMTILYISPINNMFFF